MLYSHQISELLKIPGSLLTHQTQNKCHPLAFRVFCQLRLQVLLFKPPVWSPPKLPGLADRLPLPSTSPHLGSSACAWNTLSPLCTSSKSIISFKAQKKSLQDALPHQPLCLDVFLLVPSQWPISWALPMGHPDLFWPRCTEPFLCARHCAKCSACHPNALLPVTENLLREVVYTHVSTPVLSRSFEPTSNRLLSPTLHWNGSFQGH